MKSLLRALERVGLVEIDHPGAPSPSFPPPDSIPVARAEPVDPAIRAELPRLSAEILPGARRSASEIPAAPLEPAASPASAPAADSASLIEARPFAEIYAEQQVPASPFPAERLLRVLDGLSALDPAARKTAVIALDSADDNWSIDDTLLDAERKLRVLSTYRSDIEESTRTQLEAGKAAMEAREFQHQEAAERIRKQIADLEALLERDLARASQDKAEIQAAARAARDAMTRETARVDEETARLKRIASIFGDAAGVSASSAA